MSALVQNTKPVSKEDEDYNKILKVMAEIEESWRNQFDINETLPVDKEGQLHHLKHRLQTALKAKPDIFNLDCTPDDLITYLIYDGIIKGILEDVLRLRLLKK